MNHFIPAGTEPRSGLQASRAGFKQFISSFQLMRIVA